MEKIPFKALIRVVKSLNNESRSAFDSVTVLKEPLIYASSKDEVKEFLNQKYPQFFAHGKVYEKETKDKAQFFYVVIYPLSSWEIKELDSEPWVCNGCGQVHENIYFAKPRVYHNYKFCPNYQDAVNPCIELFKSTVMVDGEEYPEDSRYVTNQSPTYIYKITEKATGKCYIGKTRNEPFFRWWNHLTHSRSPFGVYLRSTQLTDWTFEVLEILEPTQVDSEVFKVESGYIRQYDSIVNGFNMVVSQKLNPAHSP